MTIPETMASAADRAGYGDAAPLYWAAGWPAPLPLPTRRKAMPPAGWTGRDAPFPDEADVAGWCATQGHGNVALRLPAGVVGIDLDLYKPEGAASYARLLDECGPLPATWLSTSRGDGSGIRFYTVPAGVRWAERRAGPGIEIVHVAHRYAVVWPSIHPEGRTYRWYAPGGALGAGVPAVAGLAGLPAVWGRRLSEPTRPRPVEVDTHPVVRQARGFAAASLAGAVAEVAALLPGQRRNDALNRKAYALAGFVATGELDQAEVRAQLYAAAETNGHVERHGARQTLATIDSGLRAGAARPRRGSR